MKDPAFRSCDSFTQEEFARWVDEIPAGDLHHYELLDGFIVREPPAGWPHGEIEGLIVARLASFVEAEKLGRVFGSSQGFDLPSGDTVEPDVSFVTHERWRASRPVRGFLPIVPDLVFEILSPSTARIDQSQKKRIYQRNGVREYVLVDSRAKTLECFCLEHGRFDSGRRLGLGDVFRSRVVVGFTVHVDELFPEF